MFLLNHLGRRFTDTFTSNHPISNSKTPLPHMKSPRSHSKDICSLYSSKKRTALNLLKKIKIEKRKKYFIQSKIAQFFKGNKNNGRNNDQEKINLFDWKNKLWNKKQLIMKNVYLENSNIEDNLGKISKSDLKEKFLQGKANLKGGLGGLVSTDDIKNKLLAKKQNLMAETLNPGEIKKKLAASSKFDAMKLGVDLQKLGPSELKNKMQSKIKSVKNNDRDFSSSLKDNLNKISKQELKEKIRKVRKGRKASKTPEIESSATTDTDYELSAFQDLEELNKTVDGSQTDNPTEEIPLESKPTLTLSASEEMATSSELKILKTATETPNRSIMKNESLDYSMITDTSTKTDRVNDSKLNKLVTESTSDSNVVESSFISKDQQLTSKTDSEIEKGLRKQSVTKTSVGKNKTKKSNGSKIKKKEEIKTVNTTYIQGENKDPENQRKSKEGVNDISSEIKKSTGDVSNKNINLEKLSLPKVIETNRTSKDKDSKVKSLFSNKDLPIERLSKESAKLSEEKLDGDIKEEQNLNPLDENKKKKSSKKSIDKEEKHLKVEETNAKSKSSKKSIDENSKTSKTSHKESDKLDNTSEDKIKRSNKKSKKKAKEKKKPSKTESTEKNEDIMKKESKTGVDSQIADSKQLDNKKNDPELNTTRDMSIKIDHIYPKNLNIDKLSLNTLKTHDSPSKKSIQISFDKQEIDKGTSTQREKESKTTQKNISVSVAVGEPHASSFKMSTEPEIVKTSSIKIPEELDPINNPTSPVPECLTNIVDKPEDITKCEEIDDLFVTQMNDLRIINRGLHCRMCESIFNCCCNCGCLMDKCRTPYYPTIDSNKPTKKVICNTLRKSRSMTICKPKVTWDCKKVSQYSSSCSDSLTLSYNCIFGDDFTDPCCPQRLVCVPR